jgi:hypothetical protein
VVEEPGGQRVEVHGEVLPFGVDLVVLDECEPRVGSIQSSSARVLRAGGQTAPPHRRRRARLTGDDRW